MENDQKRRVIIMSLAGLLFGSLFYMFGLSIQSSIFPTIVNYAIAIIMYISSFLAVHNNNKEKVKLFTYIEFLSIFMIILITIVLFNQLFL